MPKQKPEHVKVTFDQSASSVFTKQRLSFLAVLAVVAIALMIALMVIIPREERARVTLGPQSFKALRSRDFDSNLAKRAYPLGANLVFVSGEEIVCEDYQGKQIFAYPLNMERPVIQNLGEYIMCGDRHGNSIMLLNPQGKIYESQIDYSFVVADMNDDGYCLIIDEQAEGHAKVHLFSPEGSRILSLSFAKSGHPMAAKFSPDKRYFDLLLLNTQSSQMKSILRRYDFEGGLSGQRILSDYNTLFYGLQHADDDSLLVYSPTEVLKLKYSSEEPIIQAQFNALSYVEAAGEHLIVFGNALNDAYFAIYAVSADGDVEEQVSQISQAGKFQSRSTNIYYTQSNLLARFNLQDSDKNSQLALDGEILRYHIIDDKKANVITANGARLIELP